MGKHIFYLDNLRTFIIFLGILCLAAGSFLPAPFMPPHYVFAGQQGTIVPFYYLFYEFAMALVIPVLFFLSGYFSASNLRIRLLQPYFRGRWLRLGWPLLFAIIIMMPEIAWISTRSTGYSAGFFTFLAQRFLGRGFTLGVYGFLAVLLLFTLLLMGAKKINHQALRHTEQSSPSPLFLILFAGAHLILSLVVYFGFLGLSPQGLSSIQAFFAGLGFQPSWLITAALYFLLGIYAAKHRWFIPGGYVPGSVWMIAAIGFCALYNVFPYYHVVILAFLSLSGTLGLIAAFARWGDQSSQPLLTLSHMAYPVWYLSEPVLENIMYFLLPLTIAAPLKLILALGLTLFYGYFVYKYALCHLGCFKTR